MDYYTEDRRLTMNRVICVNGHFFNGDKYESCPHCAEGTAPIEQECFSVARGVEKEDKSEKKEKKSVSEHKTQKAKFFFKDFIFWFMMSVASFLLVINFVRMEFPQVFDNSSEFVKSFTEVLWQNNKAVMALFFFMFLVFVWLFYY